MKILVTICARGGSKGLPGKNVRSLFGKPLIAHTIDLAQKWAKASAIVVSTDSEEIAEVSKQYGALVPFLRPAHLANDTVGKLPVLTHALQRSEEQLKQTFDIIVDLDPTSPLRRLEDLERGYQQFQGSPCSVCFSVVRARKNPYFNMVEEIEGQVRLVKPLPSAALSRQAAPPVWDMNASIYVYQRDFLLRGPQSLWEGKATLFEMPSESAFDIDTERDWIVTEALMKYYQMDR